MSQKEGLYTYLELEHLKDAILHEENNLNISLESDHLDPEQKAAHEADTLPMDGPQAPQTKPQTNGNKKNLCF